MVGEAQKTRNCPSRVVLPSRSGSPCDQDHLPGGFSETRTPHQTCTGIAFERLRLPETKLLGPIQPLGLEPLLALPSRTPKPSRSCSSRIHLPGGFFETMDPPQTCTGIAFERCPGTARGLSWSQEPPGRPPGAAQGHTQLPGNDFCLPGCLSPASASERLLVSPGMPLRFLLADGPSLNMHRHNV